MHIFKFSVSSFFLFTQTETILFCSFPFQRYLQQISNFFVVDLKIAGFRVKGRTLLRFFLHLPEESLTDPGY